MYSLYPNLDTAVTIFLYKMETNCSQKFERLPMTEERLSNFAVLQIESDITRKLDYADVINTLAEQGAGRRTFQDILGEL